MQRQDPEGIVLLCDFCRRDWDGQEPMIEGHHGSIICLECLKVALRDQHPATAKYTCNMCLRFNIPPTLNHWANPAHPDALICHDCITQSAQVLARTPSVPWQRDGTDA